MKTEIDDQAEEFNYEADRRQRKKNLGPRVPTRIAVSATVKKKGEKNFSPERINFYRPFYLFDILGGT